MAQHQKFPASLKTTPAVETLKSQKTTNEIPSIYQVHPKQVYGWKEQALVDGQVRRSLPGWIPGRSAGGGWIAQLV